MLAFPLRALGLGAVAGLRSMTAPAAALAATGNRLALPVTLLAAAEAIADKTPLAPARTAPPAFVVRLLSGAYSAALVAPAFEGERTVGAVCGALGALIGTLAGYHVRKAIVENTAIPDFAVACAEDFIAVAAALTLTRRGSVREAGEASETA
jgi:uncharacterized membrane protein